MNLKPKKFNILNIINFINLFIFNYFNCNTIIMLNELSYTSFEGLLLLLSMIIFGKFFRENWKNKKKNWIIRSWIYGLISSISFFLMVSLPMTN